MFPEGIGRVELSECKEQMVRQGSGTGDGQRVRVK